MSKTVAARHEILDNSEWVARIVFSPSMVFDGYVSPSAFTLRDLTPPEDYMSVMRTGIETPTPESVKYIRPVAPGDSLYGYAHLYVDAIHNYSDYSDETINAVVVAYPTKRNKAHAGIHLLKDDISYAGSGDAASPEFLNFTSYLAQIATLVAF